MSDPGSLGFAPAGTGLVPDAGFIAGKLVEALLRPSTLMLAGSVIGLALLWSGRRRLATGVLSLAIGAELLLAVIPYDNLLLSPLEDRFPPLREAPSGVAGIVVLGGAVDPVLSAAHGMPALNGAAERMTAFVALALRAPPSEVLAFTGGSGLVLTGTPSEAAIARRLFDALGLEGRSITYESRSRTTWENARDLARLLHPRADQTWILVTSAQHMPRAVAAFRDAGWHVLADPVGYKTAPDLIAAFAPDYAGRLARLDDAVHEWEGLIAYRLLGRTGRLLPGPEQP